MPKSNRDAWTPVETGDGSRTLYSARFGQTLHSHHGAITESRWVFLRGSGIEDRLAAGDGARVLEVGFGAGLNFLVTADAARMHAADLHYVALEHTLPDRGAVAALELARYLSHPLLAHDLADAVGAVTAPGRHVADFGAGHRSHASATAGPSTTPTDTGPLDGFASGAARLELWLGEATDADPGVGLYDAIYHDAFSPDVNPELWSAPFLERLVTALAPGGALVTYTVAGAVRRAFAELDLLVEKRAGPPGGKREMLWAGKPITARG